MFLIFHTSLYGMHEEVLEDEDLPDELLYGRAGYLFSIQFLEYYLTDHTCVDTKIAEKVLLSCCCFFRLKCLLVTYFM